MSKETMTQRYKALGYKEILQSTTATTTTRTSSSHPHHYRYPVACKELSFILREAYSKLPKPLRSSVFNDTLDAFRLLPLIKSQSAVAAAHVLLQSAEAELPKQKKNLAVTEFKRAMVAHKRNNIIKNHQDEEIVSHLPYDVLLQIFNFLDVKSLVSAGLTCWMWETAANDNNLWRIQYLQFFGQETQDHDLSTIKEPQNVPLSESHKVPTNGYVDWKEAFKTVCAGNGEGRLSTHRAYCTTCGAIVWLDSMQCGCNRARIRPSRTRFRFLSSSKKVAAYLLNGSVSVVHSSDSESESDSEQELVHGLWAYSIHH